MPYDVREMLQGCARHEIFSHGVHTLHKFFNNLFTICHGKTFSL